MSKSGTFETIEKENYKLLVTDTGLTSALVAAAVARLGHKVLHIDREHSYGGDWRSLHLLSLIGWTSASAYVENDKGEVAEFVKKEEERFVAVDYRHSTWHNIEADFTIFGDVDRFRLIYTKWIEKKKLDADAVNELVGAFNVILNETPSKDPKVNIEEVVTKWKQLNRYLGQLDNAFTIDLCPRVLLANGSMVELLIQSNVSRYLTFRNVDRILAPIRDGDSSVYHIQPMPLNRADVFQSKVLSLIEKRLLMRFLQGCLEWNKSTNKENFLPDSDAGLQFEIFLRDKQKLSTKLIDIVVNSLLMDQNSMTAKEAINKIVKILESMGRFSDRPYLWCTYGADDVLQAFCRYAAIYGGDYCLGIETRGLLVVNGEDERPTVKRVATNSFVASVENVVTSLPIPTVIKGGVTKLKSVSRAVICSTRSIQPSNEKDRAAHSSLLYLPPSYTGASQIFVFEADSSAETVPQGLYLQYLWCDTIETAKVDLMSTVEKLLIQSNLDKERSNPIVWSVYYCQECQLPQPDPSRIPSNVHLVSPPLNELDFDFACQQAKIIFKKILPGGEFFPETRESDGQQAEDEGESEDS